MEWFSDLEFIQERVEDERELPPVELTGWETIVFVVEDEEPV